MGRKWNYPGSKKVKKLVANAWTEDTIKAAVHKLQSVSGTSIRGFAKELKKAYKGEELKKAGRKCIFQKKWKVS